ncbi:hypothetical protein FB45DRAFT_871847 [Roridomyces roridus]|uniref:Uncharacterized protein n=1 Tax=Roridomyces roridus TaxID=1738132 RepID=A0AAD7BFP0_9AGAR|nr:hypothetical protein FB45DRAFT_872858 [Roridomyces roridus]KAJ7619745.1 hypothetical protein FB45DRAFT_871847 [Roridomyces roridus]
MQSRFVLALIVSCLALTASAAPVPAPESIPRLQQYQALNDNPRESYGCAGHLPPKQQREGRRGSHTVEQGNGYNSPTPNKVSRHSGTGNTVNKRVSSLALPGHTCPREATAKAAIKLLAVFVSVLTPRLRLLYHHHPATIRDNAQARSSRREEPQATRKSARKNNQTASAGLPENDTSSPLSPAHKSSQNTTNTKCRSCIALKTTNTRLIAERDTCRSDLDLKTKEVKALKRKEKKGGAEAMGAEAEVKSELERLRKRLESVEMENTELKAELEATKAELKKTSKELTIAQQRSRDHYCEIKALRLQVERVQTKYSEVKEAYEKIRCWVCFTGGRFTDEARWFFCQCVRAGCCQELVGFLIRCFAEVTGIEVDRVPSARTVTRAMMEGGVFGKLQLGKEIQDAPARVTRLINVEEAISHTAEDERAGLVDSVNDIIDTYNESPMAARMESTGNERLTFNSFHLKLKFMHGDHASDGKKFHALTAETKKSIILETLGQDAADLLPADDVLNQSLAVEDSEIDDWLRTRGIKDVTSEQRGTATYANPAETCRKADLDLFLTAGCGAHKDLNALKYGTTELQKSWTRNKIPGTPPVLLPNKANASTIARADKTSAAAKKAIDASCSGAIKLLELLASVLQNKDSKKGYGDKTEFLISAAMKERFGVDRVSKLVKTLASVSRVHYQGFTYAAAEVVLHPDLLDRAKINKMTLAQLRDQLRIYKNIVCDPELKKTAVWQVKTKILPIVLAAYERYSPSWHACMNLGVGSIPMAPSNEEEDQELEGSISNDDSGSDESDEDSGGEYEAPDDVFESDVDSD